MPELLERQLGQGAVRRPLQMSGVDCRIVVNHYHAVPRRVYVELYSVRSKLDSALERGERVLGVRLVRPPVRDPFGRVTVSACGQTFLPIVALSSMSAKLMSAGARGQSALTAVGPERLPVEAP